MNNKQFILEVLSKEELKRLIGESLKAFMVLKPSACNPKEELLTRKETCEFLKVDPSTLWHWTNKGKVIAYGIGNRRYYKKQELLQSLIQLKK